MERECDPAETQTLAPELQETQRSEECLPEGDRKE
ncbi:hypothetical protein chiPu_0028650, partial [Chiloscyllium punctatum]|nr:hypothetical protein [Chiloscyllium punctatum]